MKDYIIENKRLMLSQADYYTLAERVENNSKNIESIKGKMITRAELSDFMKLFDRSIQNEEILILDGQPFKADGAYQKIYRNAVFSMLTAVLAENSTPLSSTKSNSSMKNAGNPAKVIGLFV
jgi:hypothetical protein